MDHETRKPPGVPMLVYPSLLSGLLGIRVWNQKQCWSGEVSMLHIEDNLFQWLGRGRHGKGGEGRDGRVNSHARVYRRSRKVVLLISA